MIRNCKLPVQLQRTGQRLHLWRFEHISITDRHYHRSNHKFGALLDVLGALSLPDKARALQWSAGSVLSRTWCQFLASAVIGWKSEIDRFKETWRIILRHLDTKCCYKSFLRMLTYRNRMTQSGWRTRAYYNGKPMVSQFDCFVAQVKKWLGCDPIALP